VRIFVWSLSLHIFCYDINWYIICNLVYGLHMNYCLISICVMSPKETLYMLSFSEGNNALCFVMSQNPFYCVSA
jgi:hypothetical protein